MNEDVLGAMSGTHAFRANRGLTFSRTSTRRVSVATVISSCAVRAFERSRDSLAEMRLRYWRSCSLVSGWPCSSTVAT